MLITKEMYLGLTESHLSEAFGFKGTKKALEAFVLLQKEALKAGISLDIASSYRSFYRQLQIFDDKFFLRRATLDAEEKPLDLSKFSLEQKCEAILRFSAIPGMSRHHFGTDFDIYSKSLLPLNCKLQLTAYEYAEGNYFYPLEQWLAKHLENFGFYRPFKGNSLISNEPWHISFKEEALAFIEAYDLEKLIALLRLQSRPWTNYIEAKIRVYGKILLG